MTSKFFLPQTPDIGGRLRAKLPGAGLGLKTASTAPVVHRPARRRGRGGGIPLALTEISGNLTYTAATVTVWFTLGEKPWAFGSDAARENHIHDAATQLAALAGHTVQVRRTSTPFPVGQWAANLAGNSRPLPDPLPAGLPAGVERSIAIDAGWQAHLGNAVRHLGDREFTLSRTHLGVVLPRRRKKKTGDPVEVQIAQIGETVAQRGLDARPATSSELIDLIYRSVGIGLDVPSFHPGAVGVDDIAEFTEAVEWRRGPFDMTTELIDRRTGRSVHVAVLTVGRMGELDIPQLHEPWAHLSDQVDFPVDWSSRFRVLGPAAARGSVQLRHRVILSQIRDYADHRLPQPPELERLAGRAAEVGDQMDTGTPVDSGRAHGWHRLAVHGETRELCLARARDLTRIYESMLARTQLVHARNQVGSLREFIPGEADANTGYVRRLPLPMMAGAVPQATAKVGDDRGDLIGHTVVSGNRPVFLDLHFPMEVRERGGLVVLCGEPGGGKSTLTGALGYLNARRGVQVTLMDPSGPLARLCSMPELAPFSRVIDLTGSRAGTLAPYPSVPTPHRRDYQPGPDGDAKFDDAVKMAHHERRGLVYDICRMLLPVNIPDFNDVAMAIREAIGQVPAQETTTLNDVVAALIAAGTSDRHAKIAAGLLQEVSGLPQGRLFFGTPPPGTLDAAPLTVITMAGLTLPDLSLGRDQWNTDEALAVPVLHMANQLAARRCYSGDMHTRKMVGLDEAHFMAGWRSGRAFFRRLARDSRKWNIAALVASQNPGDILELDVQNLVTSVFVGRIAEDAKIAAEALRLLRLPVNDGYESVLAGLSQYDTSSTNRLGYREFAVRDVDGRVQIVRVDVSYVPGLLAALNTTPGATK